VFYSVVLNAFEIRVVRTKGNKRTEKDFFPSFREKNKEKARRLRRPERSEWGSMLACRPVEAFS